MLPCHEETRMTDLLHIVPGLGPALEQPTDGTDATATAITLTPNDIHEY
jgi:hypothetical protein